MISALVAVVAAAVLVPGPANAIDLHEMRPVARIDPIAIRYEAASDQANLHVTGWAGDLADGSDNGHVNAAVELLWSRPGGQQTTWGWGEHDQFAVPRPDAHQAYPQLGQSQGFDVEGAVPATGPVTICLRLWSFDTAEPWKQVTCASVVVPTSRPSWRPRPLAGSPSIGGDLAADLTETSPGPDTYSWFRFTQDFRAMLVPPIPGETRATHTVTAADVGALLWAVIRTSPAGGPPIEQVTNSVQGTYFDTTVTHVQGADRYATAVAASRQAFPDGGTGAPVVFVASGADFPDALSAGPAAAREGGALLLSAPGGMDATTIAELDRLHPPRVVVVGGTGALSAGVMVQLRALPFSPHVLRVFGADRYATSRAVVDEAFPSAPRVFLATGGGFADALSAASAAAIVGAPVLLTDGSLPKADSATTAELVRLGATDVTIVGGTGVVSPGIAASLGTGIAVDRLSGVDRYATSAAVAATAPGSRTVYIAQGLNFPDALVVAVLAGQTHAPLVLSAETCLPPVVLTTMADRTAVDLVMMGAPIRVQSCYS